MFVLNMRVFTNISCVLQIFVFCVWLRIVLGNGSFCGPSLEFLDKSTQDIILPKDQHSCLPKYSYAEYSVGTNLYGLHANHNLVYLFMYNRPEPNVYLLS
jgi:hypothetical protein